MPKIFYSDLDKKIASYGSNRIYFLCGKESYLIKECEKKIIKNVLGDQINTFNLIKVNGEKIDMDELQLSLETYPVFGDKKIVVIYDFDLAALSAEDKKKFKCIISDVPEFSTVIISEFLGVKGNKKTQKRRENLKIIENCGIIVDCTMTYERDIENQVIKWCAENNKKICINCVKAMILRSGKDLNTLQNETYKLCGYAGDGEISEKDIETVVTAGLEYNVFEICKAILRKDTKNVYNCLEKLFSAREDPVLILAVIAAVYTDMHKIKLSAEQHMDNNAIAEFFGYQQKDYKIKSARANAQNVDMSKIRLAIEILTESDVLLKTTAINPRFILDMAVVKIMWVLRK
jgi:DNA polymerase-3 subunit delta